MERIRPERVRRPVDHDVPARWRHWSARLLSLLAVLCLVGGLTAGVVNRELLDARSFAGHADDVRTDPDVADQIAARVTDRILAAQPDLVVLRPAIEAAAASLVASPAFSSIFRAAVIPLHEALVTGSDDNVVVTLTDVGTLLVAAVSAAAPERAARLPPELDVRLSEIGSGEPTTQLVSTAHLVATLAWLLPLAWLALTVVAAALTPVPDRGWRSWTPRWGRLVGVTLMAAAGVAAVLLVGVAFVLAHLDEDSLRNDVLVAGFDELDGSMWWAIGVAAAGGYLGWLLSLRASAAGLVDSEPSRAARLGRWTLVAGAGLLLVARPLTVVAVVATVAGFLLLVHGTLGVVRTAWEALGTQVGSRRNRDRGLGAVASLVAAALVGSAVWAAWPASTHLPAASVSADDACNGDPALCDRRYDAVTYAATHNSMSAADQPGWFFAEQPTGVLGQLDDGIRAFLIDSWYGQTTKRAGVVAGPDRTREAALREASEEFGADAVRSALRLRTTLGLEPVGTIKPYLCHAMCELGAIEWEPLMEEVRDWLDLHPREVVTFIVQDMVSPADTAALVEQAGLEPYVHTQSEEAPWPTLGQMIDSGRRVVIFMENHAGGSAAPWLMDLNEWVQDTAFHFRTAAQFDCLPNRGSADAGMLLVNHWLDDKTRRVTNAARANAASVLEERAADCERTRGMTPNFLAVDFYDRGDLLDVVDDLNGVS